MRGYSIDELNRIPVSEKTILALQVYNPLCVILKESKVRICTVSLLNVVWSPTVILLPVVNVSPLGPIHSSIIY